MTADDSRLRDRLLSLIPADGSPVGNGRLLELLAEAPGPKVTKADYERVRDQLLAEGRLVSGRGRGGAVRLAAPTGDDLVLEAEPHQEPVPAPRPKAKAGKRGGPAKTESPNLIAYRHDERRVNNPEVGMVGPDTDPDGAKKQWKYDPHLDPTLEFDVARAQIENYIDAALATGDEGAMRDALESLKHMLAPQLAWTGKAERTAFEVDTVSLHVHERIDPATMLNAIRTRMTKKGEAKAIQGDIFQAWFEAPLPYREAIEFYKHDRGWANRLISGDSLLVMNSLLVKEGMAGQVQMIYIDPPYGIKYGSNFQPFTATRPSSRTDRDEDLTQEPEMIKAFRDTWELGIHSYLTYLRDRLALASSLLSNSGSLFVQISDENHHLVRALLSEVFGEQNLVVSIPVKKKGSQKGGLLDPVNDYLVWVAKDKEQVKYRQLFERRLTDLDVTEDFANVLLKDGSTSTLTALEKADAARPGAYRGDLELFRSRHPGAIIFKADPSTGGNPGQSQAKIHRYQGRDFDPGIGRGLGWKASAEAQHRFSGMDRLGAAGRLHVGKDQLAVRRYPGDFGMKALSNWWDGLGGAADPVYVVQTNERIVERCMLMTTDPGDLIFDPTCGSGTTAVVSERWGRRWITCDTSRVAVTLAKQRLLTASFDYYDLRYPHEGVRGGFICETVPHIMASEIANNPEIDEIWGRLHPAIDSARANLNTILAKHPPKDGFDVTEGARKGETVHFIKDALEEWEVPFNFPEGWAELARRSFDAFHAARQAMQRQIDSSIAAHAQQETLHDQPQVARNKLRVTGPFTVEAVPFPSVLSLDEAEQPRDADVAIARSGESARQHGWRDELFKTGIRGKGGQILRFADLETLPGMPHLHCSGTLTDSGDRVVVSFGPEHAALEQRQVELAMREAGELFPRPKMIAFCAFAFDPEAAKDIDATKGITALKVQMNTDLLTEDLKKARSSNQSFWMMGQPDVDLRLRKDGRYEVEVNGFDYFDTAKGELVSGGKGKIAAWSLDTDYDDRSLFPRQIFFPMAGAKDGWHKLRKDIKAELDEGLLTRLHGTVSLPFDKGGHGKVAVKIVDDRGIESLKVIPIP